MPVQPLRGGCSAAGSGPLTDHVAAPTCRFGAGVGEATGSDGSLTAALDAIDAGALWQIADRLPKSDEARAATGRAAREFARPRLRAGLLQPAGGELVRQGRARWQLSRTDSATLELPEGYEETLPAALDAAVADVPDTEPLRQLLAPQDLSPPPTPPSPSPSSSFWIGPEPPWHD
ncbi:hypothetical protein [Streptomyces sp900116325]|uniref:hypothetical protein n=1 Tax=Streptomyces sp. 900116325 TaxID=3154295 RepID=UPI003322D3D4